MKILIVMGGFFPGKKYGGPPVSVDNFCTLMDMAECYIVTKNHDMGENESYKNIKNGWNDRGNSRVLYLDESQYNIRTFENVIINIQPDILYLQGLFQQCILPCLKLAQKYNLKVLLAPRGELCAGALKKKYKKIPYIYMLKALGLLKGLHYQATSEEESKSIERYLDGSKVVIHYLPNVPSIPKKSYEKDVKVSGNAKFIFLSRIVEKKNLLYAIECFNKIKGNVQFDIYGPIEDELYWNKCKKAISQLPANIMVKYKGLLSHDEVHETFSKYHVFIFPTFSENYGHVIAEAILSECLIIISDQTPWNDVNEYECGGSYSLFNQKCFVDIIQKIVLANEQDMKQYRQNIQRYINEKIKVSDIKKIYYETIKNYIES